MLIYKQSYSLRTHRLTQIVEREKNITLTNKNENFTFFVEEIFNFHLELEENWGGGEPLSNTANHYENVMNIYIFIFLTRIKSILDDN